MARIFPFFDNGSSPQLHLFKCVVFQSKVYNNVGVPVHVYIAALYLSPKNFNYTMKQASFVICTGLFSCHAGNNAWV